MVPVTIIRYDCIVILSILGASTEAYPTFKLNLVWWYPFFFTKAFLQTNLLTFKKCSLSNLSWTPLKGSLVHWLSTFLPQNDANKENVPFVFQVVGSGFLQYICRRTWENVIFPSNLCLPESTFASIGNTHFDNVLWMWDFLSIFWHDPIWPDFHPTFICQSQLLKYCL